MKYHISGAGGIGRAISPSLSGNIAALTYTYHPVPEMLCQIFFDAKVKKFHLLCRDFSIVHDLRHVRYECMHVLR